jgi:hypothetical protein
MVIATTGPRISGAPTKAALAGDRHALLDVPVDVLRHRDDVRAVALEGAEVIRGGDPRGEVRDLRNRKRVAREAGYSIAKVPTVIWEITEFVHRVGLA